MEAHSGTKMEVHSAPKMEAHAGTNMEAHSAPKMEPKRTMGPKNGSP